MAAVVEPDRGAPTGAASTARGASAGSAAEDPPEAWCAADFFVPARPFFEAFSPLAPVAWGSGTSAAATTFGATLVTAASTVVAAAAGASEGVPALNKNSPAPTAATVNSAPTTRGPRRLVAGTSSTVGTTSEAECSNVVPVGRAVDIRGGAAICGGGAVRDGGTETAAGATASGTVVNPPTKAISRLAISRMLAGRCAGSLRSSWWMRSASGAGAEGISSRTSCGCSVRWATTRSPSPSRTNGGRPANISYITQPSE